MDDNNQQGQGQKKDMSGDGGTKCSGDRVDRGRQSHDIGRLEHYGHEFSRTGETQHSNDPQNQQQGEFDDAGQGDPAKQKQAPLGSTNPAESRDSWRPSADPAAGDMATGSDREDVTP
jgi:hypothetical protein